MFCLACFVYFTIAECFFFQGEHFKVSLIKIVAVFNHMGFPVLPVYVCISLTAYVHET